MTSQLHLWALAGTLAALVLYAAGVRAVSRHRSRGWPARRSAAFAAGLAAGVVAVASPLAALAEERLSAHMWQHLLLAFVAAPLVVLGAPLSLALQSLRDPWRQRLAGAVRSRAGRGLVHPLTTWTLFATAVVATHLTGFYDAAARSEALHALEHALYISTGLLFWVPVIGTNPVRQVHSWLGRAAYLVLAMPPMSAVAAVLVYAEAPRYPSYAGPGALADQQAAGAIMAVAGAAVLVTAGFVRAWQAILDEERRQRVLDGLEAGR